jgi:hypothetical protein
VIDSMSAVASNPPRVSCPRSMSARRSSMSMRIARDAAGGSPTSRSNPRAGPRFMRDRHQSRRRAVGNTVEPLLQPPEHQAQPRRRGLQQERHEDRELPEAHAMLAQQPPRVLVQRLDVIGDLGARHDAVALHQPERHAARQPGDRLVAGHGQKRLELRGDLAVDEMLQPALHLEDHLGARILLDEGLRRGFHRLGPRDQPPTACSPHRRPPSSVISKAVSGAL